MIEVVYIDSESIQILGKTMHMVKQILKTLRGIRNIFWGDSQTRIQDPKTCKIIGQGKILGKNN